MIDKGNGYNIIIPYDGVGNSLKVALRSIERYVPVNRLFIVTDRVPAWLQNVEIVRVPDKHKSNKDANLFDKVIAAIKQGNLSGDFIFWSDDQVALVPYVPAVITNHRDAHEFKSSKKWERRMKRTVEFIEERTGKPMDFNYDSHCPQLMDAQTFLKLQEIDYQSGLGYCICTLYYGINEYDGPVEKQLDIKVTKEKSEEFDHNTLNGKRFLGFNETGYNASGLRQHLEYMFGTPSKYEKT